MDNERIRAICMALPNTAETVNWGHHLVYWVGDRDIGGKMFAMTDLDGSGIRRALVPLRSGALPRIAGGGRHLSASPYLAKAHWVTVERWDALRPRQIEDELRRAHALIYDKLPKRTKTLLALPEKERTKLIRDRKKLLEARAKASKPEADIQAQKEMRAESISALFLPIRIGCVKKPVRMRLPW
jgi:predicted DNA-binding protein (MmcQ/YjbR family)